MIKRLSLLLCLLLWATSSHAALLGRLPDSDGNFQAYYDDEADLTWLADASYAMTSGYDADGRMTWADANAWAAGLTIGGVGGWRLPSSLNSDGSGPCAAAYNCSDSEMGNLYYNVLGNPAGGPLSNAEPFSNVLPSGDMLVAANVYWSSTESVLIPPIAFNFNFDDGYQTVGNGYDDFYSWAVQSGDVSAVPIPAAVWLFGTGLLGLIGVARRRANV